MASTLAFHLSSLEAHLRQDGDAPSWSRILIVEDAHLHHGTPMRVPRAALHDPGEFRDRFEALVARGYGWINLVGNGVLGDALVVSVEMPRDPTGIASSEVPVNLSGPYFQATGAKQWDLSGRLEVI
jgi:hypothetical protein